MSGGGDAPGSAEPRGQRLLALQDLDDRIGRLQTEVADLEAAIGRRPRAGAAPRCGGAAEAERQESRRGAAGWSAS